MARLQLLLSVACVTGVAAVATPRIPADTAPAPAAVAAAVPAAAVKAPEVSVSWMDRYGYYNTAKGNWDMVPVVGAKGC